MVFTNLNHAEKSAGPLTAWLGFATFGVMVVLVSAFRSWTAAQWLYINYPWKLFTANVLLLVTGTITTLFLLAAANEIYASLGYDRSLWRISSSAAVIYSLLSLCIEAVLLWQYNKALTFWFAAGWVANSLWWTLYSVFLMLLIDD